MNSLKVGRRDRLLLSQCPMHGHLGLSKVKAWHCRNSGGIFLPQASNIWDKFPHVAVKLAQVLGFFFSSYVEEISQVYDEKSMRLNCQDGVGGRAGEASWSHSSRGFLLLPGSITRSHFFAQECPQEIPFF